MTGTFSFAATVWEHDGDARVALRQPAGERRGRDRRAVGGAHARLRLVRVEVTIGASTWRTSLFPDGRRGTYVLPVKRAVRTAEGLAAGSPADVELRLLDVGGDGIR